MLATLASEPTRHVDDVTAFQAHRPSRDTTRAALEGGFSAARMGWAFAAGYRAATVALLGAPAAIVISEAGGTHPRAIQTRFEKGRLTGDKSFVTLPEVFPRLAVLARREDGALAMALCRTSEVTLTPRRPSPFIPEIPHFRARLDGVCGELLEEDGWQLSKRFRTQEDIHVTLATLGFLMRTRWDHETTQALYGCISQLLGCATLPDTDPGTLVALGDALERTLHVFRGLPLEHMPEPDRGRWQRDQMLLSLPQAVHSRRLERALEDLNR